MKHTIELPAIPEAELQVIDVRMSDDGSPNVRVTSSPGYGSKHARTYCLWGE